MYKEGRAVDIIYLDFQKAFDKVPHRKLLNKVESHGISGHIHRWISDWLCDHKFYQELLKENSNPRLKGNRKGIIVKGKEFYIPILNTFPTR